MVLPLAVPLVPAAGAAALGQAALLAGGAAILTRDLFQFRRGPLPIPPPGALADGPTLAELLADAVAGAKVPVGFPTPPPLGDPDKVAGWLASGVLAYRAIPDLLQRGAEFLWGLLNPQKGTGDPDQPGISTTNLGQLKQRAVWFTVQPWRHEAQKLVNGVWQGTSAGYVEAPRAEALSGIGDRLRVRRPKQITIGPAAKEQLIYRIELLAGETVVAFKDVGSVVGLTASDARAVWTVGPTITDLRDGTDPANLIIWSSGRPLPRPVVPVPAAQVLPVVNDGGPAMGGDGGDLLLQQAPAAAPGGSQQGWSGSVAVAAAAVAGPASPQPVGTPAVGDSQVGAATGPAGSTAAPAPAVPAPSPLPVPIRPILPAPERPLLPDGTIAQPAPAPVPVTRPGTVTVGSPSNPITIVPAPVPATLEGIAEELGRVERKLEVTLGDGSSGQPKWQQQAEKNNEWLGRLIEAIFALNSGTTYGLTSPCEKDADGNLLPPVEVPVPPDLNMIGAVVNRLDALAKLLQVHKNLKQPVCPPEPVIRTGEWVTVNFEGLAKSPAGDKPLRKVLRYRDQTSSSLEVHAAHWHHFEWEAGPAQVTHEGLPWGRPQVWAASAEEGKRVIRHAAAVAGVNISDPKGKWVVAYTDSTRVGKPGRMAIRRLRNGALMVSKRTGSDGLAEYPIPTGL